MVTLIYSNVQPFFLPHVPFPARNANREEHLQLWADAASPDLGTWKVRNIEADDRTDAQRAAAGLGPLHRYRDDLAFWRAYPVEVGERLCTLLHCEHQPDEPDFAALVTLLHQEFNDRFNGVVRWEQYYLDWGYGSSDVTFELELDSLNDIDPAFRTSINKFAAKLSQWRETFDYEQFQAIGKRSKAAQTFRTLMRPIVESAAFAGAQRAYEHAQSRLGDASEKLVSQPAFAGLKRPPAPLTQSLPQGSAGITNTYGDYFCFITPAETGDKIGYIGALKRLTTGPAVSKEIDPGLEAFSMSKGEYAFLVTSQEAFHRSRNLCSLGVMLFDAVQAMGSSVGPIPALRRQIAGLDPKRTKRFQSALKTLGTVELRVIELGAMSRPVRLIGDDFDRAIYDAFWKTQAGGETLDTVEWEIKQTRSIMQTAVDAHFSRQQWGLSMVGFFIGALGAVNAIRTLLDAAQRAAFIAERDVPFWTMGLQTAAMGCAVYAAIAFFRR